MSSPAHQLVIDARHRGPRGPLAAESVLGRPILNHLLDQAFGLSLPGRSVVVIAPRDEQGDLSKLLSPAQSSSVDFSEVAPHTDAAVLRCDRLYHTGRLRRALRRGHDTEAAVLWRLDRPGALSVAGEELNRRLNYQPLGRFWAFPLAEQLATALQPTWVRPNAVTVVAAALMVSAAGLVAFAGLGWLVQATTSMALALALVLDTADGRLARLQGTSSAYGRWLDQILDELADMALHLAIAWASFQQFGTPAWLVVGMFYAAGKYLFLVQSLTGTALEHESDHSDRQSREAWSIHAQSESALGRVLSQVMPKLRGVAAAMGHADFRWHLWIVLALVGRLDIALITYAVYFTSRALAGGLSKAVAHA